MRAKDLMQQDQGLTMVFQDCIDMIKGSDWIIAILDGSDADSGTAVGLEFDGVAYLHHAGIGVCARHNGTDGARIGDDE
jgi:hypothetical protein